MTDDELMKLAAEAGATRYASPDYPDRPRHTFNMSGMHRFARLILDRTATQLTLVQVHPNHMADLRYILATLERLTPVVKHQKSLREQVQASITGMRYIISRTKPSAPEAPAQSAGKSTLDPNKIQLCREGHHSAEALGMGQPCICPPGTCNLWCKGMKPAQQDDFSGGKAG